MRVFCSSFLFLPLSRFGLHEKIMFKVLKSLPFLLFPCIFWLHHAMHVPLPLSVCLYLATNQNLLLFHALCRFTVLSLTALWLDMSFVDVVVVIVPFVHYAQLFVKGSCIYLPIFICIWIENLGRSKSKDWGEHNIYCTWNTCKYTHATWGSHNKPLCDIIMRKWNPLSLHDNFLYFIEHLWYHLWIWWSSCHEYHIMWVYIREKETGVLLHFYPFFLFTELL